MSSDFSYTILITSMLATFSTFGVAQAAKNPDFGNSNYIKIQSNGQYYMQAGAFKSEKNAQQFKHVLIKKYNQPVTIKLVGSYHVVLLGPVQSANKLKPATKTNFKTIQNVRTNNGIKKSSKFTKTVTNLKVNYPPNLTRENIKTARTPAKQRSNANDFPHFTDSKYIKIQLEGLNYMQAGSFKSVKNAQNFRLLLTKKYNLPITVRLIKSFHVVLIGPIPNTDQRKTGANVNFKISRDLTRKDTDKNHRVANPIALVENSHIANFIEQHSNSSDYSKAGALRSEDDAAKYKLSLPKKYNNPEYIKATGLIANAEGTNVITNSNNKSPPDKNSPASDTAITSALEAEGKGEWQKAISIYLDLLIKEPNRADIWVRIATIQQSLKNTDGAITAYEHAVEINPNNPIFYKALSELYAEKNQPKPALENIIKAVHLQPNNKTYLISQIQLANWNKDTKLALERSQYLYTLTKNTNSKEENLKLLDNISKLQSELHQYAAAAETIKLSLELDPKNAMRYQSLANCYINDQEYQNGLQSIDKALSLEPQNKSLYLTKLRLANEFKNDQLVIETQKKILSLSTSPKEMQTSLLELGGELNVQKRPHEALKLYQQALLIDPKNAKIYQKISETYAAMNDPQNALIAINNALSIEPQNREFLKAKATLASWSK
ncbi:MAG: SPOR domain-containing protein, partial [Tatlockia sp.]|nr:SPOR domain-containing protein [Tatlockia sp.]